MLQESAGTAHNMYHRIHTFRLSSSSCDGLIGAIAGEKSGKYHTAICASPELFWSTNRSLVRIGQSQFTLAPLFMVLCGTTFASSTYSFTLFNQPPHLTTEREFPQYPRALAHLLDNGRLLRPPAWPPLRQTTLSPPLFPIHLQVLAVSLSRRLHQCRTQC